MLHFSALTSAIVVFIGLSTLYLFLINDVFKKIHTLRFDIITAIKDQAPIPMAAPAPVALPTTSRKLLEDAEKWRSLVSMTSVIPQG